MDVLKNLLSMPTIAWFLLFFATINRSFSLRILGDPSPSQHHTRRSITFYMLDVLGGTQHPSSSPATAKLNGQLPFPKPLGIFPPAGGIPLPDPTPTIPVTGQPAQTLDLLPGIGISFPVRAAFQELELGAITGIDEALFQGAFGSVLVGKAEGMYVSSSEDGGGHMMAMTASFSGGGYKDGLRFFGLHRTDAHESHVVVIGGIGKYHNANGYAIIRSLNLSSNIEEKKGGGVYRVLKFNVHLG
ncbi:hypothetical protein U1Q18_022099 [Sarracenia purpurea var. burkii]